MYDFLHYMIFVTVIALGGTFVVMFIIAATVAIGVMAATSIEMLFGLRLLPKLCRNSALEFATVVGSFMTTMATTLAIAYAVAYLI